MATKYQLKALLLMFVLLAIFLGTLGTLLTIPLLFLIIFTLSVVFTNFLGSQWVPTPSPAINLIVKETKVHKAKVFYDLGSGDARLVIEVAKHTSAKAIGIEIDPLKWILSLIKIKLNKAETVKILRQNFFKSDLSDADVIFCYLPTSTMKKLEPKMKKLDKGTIIIAYRIKFPSLKPIKELKQHKVYIYRI